MRNKILSIVLCLTMVLSLGFGTTTVLADSSKVVTIGANLTKDDKEKMYKYFGVTPGQFEEIEVNNQQERELLKGIASSQDIGSRTYSCAYISPTDEGSGIRVRLANITKITSNMIASALTTAGIYDCDVLVAAPFGVSGTGALTGIMLAFEKVTGEEIPEDQKKLATEELVTTKNLSDELAKEITEEKTKEEGATTEDQKKKVASEAQSEAKDTAAGMMTEIKTQVIANNVTNKTDITNIVNEVSNRYNITLNQTQVTNIVNVMSTVAAQDYDINKLSTTFSTITENTSKNLGLKVSDKVSGILSDSVSGAVGDAKEEATGFFGSIGNFFKSVGSAIGNFFKGIGNWIAGLFGGGKSDEDPITATEAPTATGSPDKDEDLGILGGTDDSALSGSGEVVIDSTVDEIKTTQPPQASTAPETSSAPAATGAADVTPVPAE